MTLFKDQDENNGNNNNNNNKIDYGNYESHGFKAVSTRKIAKKEEPILKKYKCSGFYSGGPI